MINIVGQDLKKNQFDKKNQYDHVMLIICDTIKGNESLVETIYFYFLTPLS